MTNPTKITIEIHPDGGQCGKCRHLKDDDVGTGFAECGLFPGAVGAERLPACLAAEQAARATAPSTAMVEAWRGLKEACLYIEKYGRETWPDMLRALSTIEKLESAEEGKK
jgi:hypothetical protein